MKNMAARLQSLEVIEEVSSASFTDPLLLQDSSSGLSSSFLPSWGDGAVLPHFTKFFQTNWRSNPVECSTPIGQLLLRKELRYLMWQHTFSQTELSQRGNTISVSQGAPVQRLLSGGNPFQSTRQAFSWICLQDEVKVKRIGALCMEFPHPRNCRKKLMRLRIRSKVSLLKTEYLGLRVPCAFGHENLDSLQH